MERIYVFKRFQTSSVITKERMENSAIYVTLKFDPLLIGRQFLKHNFMAPCLKGYAMHSRIAY